MAVSLTPYLRAVSEAEDPKKEIIKWVGNIKKEILFGDRILVGTYARPSKMASGLYLTDQETVENRFQGVIGLYLAKGPTAWKYQDGAYSFEGDEPKLHSWLIFRPADSFEIAVHRASCRIMRSESVIGVASLPEIYY